MDREQADQEAKLWIEELRKLQGELVDKDGVYRPERVFAPQGTQEVDLVQQVINEQSAQKFQPTAEQLEEAARAKSMPIPSKRDETIEFLTNLIMRHGRKARAEKIMSQALYLVHLRLRTDPVELVKRIVEDMGPLVKLKRYTDGGARSELVPIPMSPRQRQHQAWSWIVEAANKRGSKDFSVRLAEEIIAAAEGNSPGFEKRDLQHKNAVVNRAFVKLLQK